jgi:serine/threonine protein kinase
MDKVQLNLSFHNLSSMVENLKIFHKSHGRYSIVSPLKLNEKRAIYLVKDNYQSESAKEPIYKVLKFLLQVNTTDELIRIYRFYEGIDHPNFCKIEAIEEIDRFIMIVQEHVDGLTLQEYFQTDLSKAQKYRVLFDLVFALDYIHDYSIVHGDIKPDNIIVRTGDRKRYGTPVIIDYDLGKDMSHSDYRITKKPFGTNLYMSPEMINIQIYSFKTDIWSLGMTLYSCIVPSKIIQCDLHHVLTYESSDAGSPTKTLPKSPSFSTNAATTSPKRGSLTRSPRSRSITNTSPRPSPTSSPSKSPSKSSKSSLSKLSILKSSPLSPTSLGRSRRSSKSGSLNSPYRNSLKYNDVSDTQMTYSSPRSFESLRTVSFSTKMIGGLYDFDHMVHQLDRNRHIIQEEYGSLFYNTIRVMLLKDYRRRPSAHRLKSVMVRSKYYIKLYPQDADGSSSLSSDSESDSYSAEIFAESNIESDPIPAIEIDPETTANIEDNAQMDNLQLPDQSMRTSASNPSIPNDSSLDIDTPRFSRSMTDIRNMGGGHIYPIDLHNPDLETSEEIIHEIGKAEHKLERRKKSKARKSKSRSKTKKSRSRSKHKHSKVKLELDMKRSESSYS